jgi:hypothetical protein
MLSKLQQQIWAALLVVIGIYGMMGGFSGYGLYIMPTQNNANVTRSWVANGTAYYQWSNGTTTTENMTDVFQEFWYVPTFAGIFVFAYSVCSHPSYSHYRYEPYPSPASSSSDDEDESDEEIPEAKSVKGVGVEILKCPNCAAPLKFAGSTVTTCEYCGNEARRKND